MSIIMESPSTSIRTEAQIAQANLWWDGLSDSWKQAFNEVALCRSSTEPLGEEKLLAVYNSPNQRFAGPGAPYPNMSFELEDMSGVAGLPNLEILVVIFHKLTHIREVSNFKTLRSLFVYNNQITSLDGIESLLQLKELYCQSNQLSSILPLTRLTNLQTLYCNYNNLENLDGITANHTDNLENFFCLPNGKLKDSTALRFEQTVGIRCRKG